MTVLPETNDVLFAFKATGLMPFLTRNEARVLSAIVDHFNRKTGRCDPSVLRIAGLLNVNRSTVLRATKRLSELGFLCKTSHGGHYGCTKYQPNWAQLRWFVERWDKSMKSGKPCPELRQIAGKDDAGRSPNTSHPCDPTGRGDGTQTNITNQAKEPIYSLSLNPSLSDATGAVNYRGIEWEKGRQAQDADPLEVPKTKKNNHWSEAQARLLQTVDLADEVSAQRNDAEDRLNRDLTDLGQTAYARVIDAVTDGLWQKAIAAELELSGSGKRLLLKLMDAAKQ